MNRLETERLLLREWRADDFEAYARICADVSDFQTAADAVHL